MIRAEIYVLPGFGMNGPDLDVSPVENESFSITYIPLAPNWKNGESFSAIAADMCSVICEADQYFTKNSPEVVTGIYGFSVGADMIMEMANSGKLAVRPSTILLPFDPNIDSETCFVTRLASKEGGTFDDFKDSFLADAPLDPIEKASYEDYIECLESNGAAEHWDNYRKIASDIYLGAPTRFNLFFQKVQLGHGRLPGKQQVHVELSVASAARFKKSNRHPPNWVKCRPDMEHFALRDPGMINRQVQEALLVQHGAITT